MTLAKKTAEENSIAVLRAIVAEWKIPVTSTGIEKLKLNPHYPSLASLSEILQEWNVKNMAVKVPLSKLTEIPLPAIAHVKKNEGHFVMLKKIETDKINYVDPETGPVREPIQDFNARWTGVILIAMPDESSGEKAFHENKTLEKKEALKKILLRATVFVCVALAFVGAIENGFLGQWAFVFGIQAVGFSASLLLLATQLDSTNPLADMICRRGTANGCKDVVSSTTGSLFGLGLPEWVMVYFTGTLLTSFVASATGQPLQTAVLHTSLLAFPFTVYTIYYQWIRIKKWCALCLIVTALIWGETAWTVAMTSFQSVPSFQHFLLVIMCSGLAFIAWLAVRNRILLSTKLPRIEKRVANFARNRQLFHAALASSKNMEIAEHHHEVLFGSDIGADTLTIITSPVCSPCARAHRLFTGLQRVAEGKLKVSFVFLSGPPSASNYSYHVSLHLIALSLMKDTPMLMKAMESWYSHQDKNKFEAWIETFPAPEEMTEAAKKILEQHNKQCYQAQISGTPAFLLNDKLILSDYSFEDIYYHLQNL